MDWSKAGVLGVAAMILLVGGIRSWQAGKDGWAFLAAGFLMLGVWATVELHDRWHKDKKNDQPPND